MNFLNFISHYCSVYSKSENNNNFCFHLSAADSVDTSGTVDGVFTQETISLTEVQHIRGLTTFMQLEVTEGLDVSMTLSDKFSMSGS